MSREAAVAVGLSLAVHVGVIGYIATQKFAEMTAQVVDANPIVVETYERERAKPPPEPKSPPPNPVRARDAPPIVDPPVRPIETAVVPQPPVNTDPPQAIVPSVPPPQPPVQLADARSSQSPAARVIRNPSWLRRPTGAEIGRLYPRRAAEAGLGGGATLMCEVVGDGSVRGCVVIDEAPKGRGFGEAALASARLFKLNPRTVDGEAVEGAKVRIPLVFSLTD
jgi:protein TonB